MHVKGKQFVPHGRRVVMAFPGGGGYGAAQERDVALVRRDLARGYISATTATEVYGLGQSDIDAVAAAVAKGEDI